MSRFPLPISWNQLAREITRQHETPSRVYLSAIENLITSKCVPILYLLSCLFKLSWNSILEAHYNIKVSWVSDLWGKNKHIFIFQSICASVWPGFAIRNKSTGRAAGEQSVRKQARLSQQQPTGVVQWFGWRVSDSESESVCSHTGDFITLK